MKKILNKFFKPIFGYILNPKIRYKILPIVNNLFAKNRKEEILEYVFGFVNFAEIDGDYMEFGVWKGGSLVSAYHISKRFENLNNMRFYAFDSFKGLPVKEGVDASQKEFNSGEYACSLENVKSNLYKTGVDLKRVEFIPGWFQDVLNDETRISLKIKKASVIYVDCDLYESARIVLDFVTPYVVDGTIIVFDDWYCFKGHPERGERKAFKEWLEKNSKFSVTPYRQYGWMGNSFIINSK